MLAIFNIHLIIGYGIVLRGLSKTELKLTTFFEDSPNFVFYHNWGSAIKKDRYSYLVEEARHDYKKCVLQLVLWC